MEVKQSVIQMEVDYDMKLFFDLILEKIKEKKEEEYECNKA